MSSVSALSTKHAIYVAHVPLGCMWSRQFYVPAHRIRWVELQATSSVLWISQSSSPRCIRSVSYLVPPLYSSDYSQEMIPACCDPVAKPQSDTAISTSLYLWLSASKHSSQTFTVKAKSVWQSTCTNMYLDVTLWSQHATPTRACLVFAPSSPPHSDPHPTPLNPSPAHLLNPRVAILYPLNSNQYQKTCCKTNNAQMHYPRRPTICIQQQTKPRKTPGPLHGMHDVVSPFALETKNRYSLKSRSKTKQGREMRRRKRYAKV